MKEIKVVIPIDKMKIVQELQENLDLDFRILVSEEQAVFTSIIENNQTALVIEELKGIGVGQVFGSILVSPVDIEIRSDMKDSPAVVKSSMKSRGISLDEMIQSTKGLGVVSPTFIILSILAGGLSSFGLFYDNVVIIIASMIIAPFLGPIALTVIGTMLPENRFKYKPFLSELLGIGICVAIGMFTGAMFEIPDPLPDQIAIRTDPAFYDILFAILSGLAAGIFIIRGESTSIVGVAVAASLCPPAANIGILLVNMEFSFALGSTILLSLNIISIYFACAVIFWISRSLVRGGTITARQFKKVSRRYYFQIIIAIAVLTTIIMLILIGIF